MSNRVTSAMTTPQPLSTSDTRSDGRPGNREVARRARQAAKRYELLDLCVTAAIVGGIAVIVGFGVSFICVITISSLFTPIDAAELVPAAVISLAVAVLLAGLVVHQLCRSWFVHLATDWRARGLCWFCRYSLAGLAARSDGSITCPECGRVHQRWQWSDTPERALPTSDSGLRSSQSLEGRATFAGGAARLGEQDSGGGAGLSRPEGE